MSNETRESVLEKIKEAEAQLVATRQQISELRQDLPRERLEKYKFLDGAGKVVDLADLFGDRSDLLLVHNMGKSCAYCTLWADGYEGFRKHIEDRTAFALVSPDDPEVMQAFAESRDWKFRTVSAQGSSFSYDMGYEDELGRPLPGVSTFVREDDGQVYRVATASFGPGDDYCSIWHLFGLLAGGTSDWQPRSNY